MSEFKIVRDFPHPIAKVWQVLTDPQLVPRWTSTGQGGRPEGFAPVAGTKFQFVAKPVAGWRGIVDCEVLEVEAPHLLRYTWVGDVGEKPSLVTYHLSEQAGGTRLTWEHIGFAGVGGFVMSRLLRNVRTKMLSVALPSVLDDPGLAV
jgi:uncharacterized protein YndB with AHSA1/START domain